MARRRTRTEIEIEKQLQQLDPATERYRMLVAARNFNASWVSMGAELTQLKEGAAYREWGYASFESYCRRELRFKQDTVNKLTRSFSFLRDHEPEALARRNDRELPPLEVVDLLTQAKERSQLSDDELCEIQREVFEPDAHSTKRDVLKRFREFDPDAFRASPKEPLDESEETDLPAPEEIRKALVIAERLYVLLNENQGLSTNSRNNLKKIVDELTAQSAFFERKTA